MSKKSLKINFIKYCNDNKFEVNSHQIEVIKSLDLYYQKNSISLKNLFKSNLKLGFYLHGDVGVGKTMILNFFYNSLKISKKKVHFNEFMINFHDHCHKVKKKDDKGIDSFVKKLTRYKLIFLDELQVTNIVDAMILGRLFKIIFQKKIKILFSSNTKIEELYAGGLQRDQFLPFIDLINDYSIQKKLVIPNDYRKLRSNKLKRLFFPLNEETNFSINQLFRKLTKNKISQKKKLKIKGREFIISNFYDGIFKIDFKLLCNVNIGAEDYIKIAECSKLIIIENIPKFDDENLNQQQRFITMIDIFYEKKIQLIVSLKTDINNLGTANKLIKPFKRTISRLYELTSSDFSI